MITILTKTLRDGSTCTVTIEPDGDAGWQLRVGRPASTDITKARPHKLPKSQKGISHALTVGPGKDGIAIGLTRAEAEAMTRAIDYFTDQRLKAARARRCDEVAALSAQLRAAAPGAPTWTVSDPTGVPSVGETCRHDGRIVTGLKIWQRHYAEDGMSFGADDDSGYVHFAEVREATAGEAAPVLAREETQRRRQELRASVQAEIVAPASRPATENEVPELPEIQFGDRLTHLRVDREASTVWVLHYNGHDGGNWSYNNYRCYIARRVELTERRDQLVIQLAAEFGTLR